MSAASRSVDDAFAAPINGERPRAPLILTLFAAAVFALSGLADAARALIVALTGERVEAWVMGDGGAARVRFAAIDGAIHFADLAHDARGFEAVRVVIAYDPDQPDEAYVLDGAAAWRGSGVRLALALGLCSLASLLWPRGALSPDRSSRNRPRPGS